MPPSYAVDFRGFPACPCQAEWIPAFELEAQRRGWLVGEQHIYQMIGGALQSGGTHIAGGADDTEYLNDNLIWLSREMGADATWHRRFNWDGAGGMPHVHRVLRGCPHNFPARYQIDAVDDGFNGLGHLGHGAPDDGPRPLSGRTWQQGIEWAEEQDVSPEQEDRIVKRVTVAVTNAILDLSKVDREEEVSVRQALNQIRNAVKK